MGNLYADLGYGRAFSGKFAVGLQFHYLLEHAHQYESRHSLAVELSFSARMGGKWQIGVALFNPLSMKYGIAGKQPIPLDFNVEMSYKIGKQVLLRLRCGKEQPGALTASGAVDFHIHKVILGLGAGTQGLELLVVLPLKKFILQFSGEYSFRLGYSPGLEGIFLYPSYHRHRRENQIPIP